MQGVQVQPLVGELRSHIPQGLKNQIIKQKQYCNKFNEEKNKLVSVMCRGHNNHENITTHPRAARGRD